MSGASFEREGVYIASMACLRGDTLPGLRILPPATHKGTNRDANCPLGPRSAILSLEVRFPGSLWELLAQAGVEQIRGADARGQSQAA